MVVEAGSRLSSSLLWKGYSAGPCRHCGGSVAQGLITVTGGVSHKVCLHCRPHHGGSGVARGLLTLLFLSLQKGSRVGLAVVTDIAPHGPALSALWCHCCWVADTTLTTWGYVALSVSCHCCRCVAGYDMTPLAMCSRH